MSVIRDHIETLMNSQFSRYYIHKQTGIPTTTLSRIWNLKASLDNVTLLNAEKLSKFYEEHKEDERMKCPDNKVF